MSLDIVKPLVDAFQHQQQVRGGASCRTGGVQHQVAHRTVELLAVLCDSFHTPQADAYNQREFGIRKSLEKLWEWNVFSIFKGKNQQVT